MANHARNVAGRTAVDRSTVDADRQNPRWNFHGFHIEKRRCWGPISVDIVDRAAGEAICRSNCYRLTYFLSDFQATMEDDEGPQWECRLLRGHFVFRPPGTTLRANLTCGRYIQILQNHDTYVNFTSEMAGVGATHVRPGYNLSDPLISQLVLAIANKIEGGFLDRVLADAFNTALAVQLTRLCGNPSAITLEPYKGLSRERLQRVYDYIEVHLDHSLNLTDLASVACLSSYHFSRSFKQAVGIGPRRYVTQRRLERAKTLMRRTNQPLALIAQEAGFSDQSHLTSVFHREIGITPGQFRAALS